MEVTFRIFDARSQEDLKLLFGSLEMLTFLDAPLGIPILRIYSVLRKPKQFLD